MPNNRDFYNLNDLNKNAGNVKKEELKSTNEILKEISYGKILTELLDIPTTTDILIWETYNNKYPYKVRSYDSQAGVHDIDLDNYSKEDVEHIKRFVNDVPVQIGARINKIFNAQDAILDGFLQYKDNSILRINSVEGALTGTGKTILALRKTSYSLTLKKETMLYSQFLDEHIYNLLTAASYSFCNIIIGGITGSGKTSLLRYLAINATNDKQAIITIEDTLEAYIGMLAPQKMVQSFKSNDKYSFGDLLITSLRQNPDWIMVSEARDKECVSKLLSAAETGHGIISTIHASSAKNIPDRIVDMTDEYGISAERVFNKVHKNINLGVYIDYFNDDKGSHRKITEICEFYVDDNNKEHTHVICKYNAENKSYDYNFIESTDIKNKLYKANKARKLKGVFLQ